MPLVDPVLVLADEADDDVELRELHTLARRVGTPVVVRCAHRLAARKLIRIARDQCPRAILITSSPVNDRISAEVAVGLEAAIVTDVTDLSFDDDHLVAISDRVSSEIHTQTAVITVRPRIHEPHRELLLTEADVVVAGGRGVGSAAGFSLLARVAHALGGCLGGTHTAGELGWCPRHARISLPGAQIHPRLYLAGGVSGSVRHRSAIRGAQTVVAIDSDPNAPILHEADFGIVGDLHQILPALLDELAARATRSPESASPESSRSAGCADLPPESAFPDSSPPAGCADLRPGSVSPDSSRSTACAARSSESAFPDSSRSTGCADLPLESAFLDSSPPAGGAARSSESASPSSSRPAGCADLPPESASPGSSPSTGCADLPPGSASPDSSPPAATPDPSPESALSVTSSPELAEA